MCGSVGACYHPYDPLQLDELRHVRCCSDSPKSGWVKMSDACPYAESNLLDNLNTGMYNVGCPKATTHQGAQKMCADAGARLCTMEELSNDCAATSGCGFDEAMVWSSSCVADGTPEIVSKIHITCDLRIFSISQQLRQ